MKRDKTDGGTELCRSLLVISASNDDFSERA